MENKRQSVGGSGSRSGTPKLAGSGELGHASVLGKVVGASVKLTTTSPPLELSGTCFCADPILNVIILQRSESAKASSPSDYHIVPVSQIQSLQVLALQEGRSFENAIPPIARVNLAAVMGRETDAVKKTRALEADKGKGVSKEGQEIFDALKKYLPLRWNNQEMVCNDNVLIKPPYRPENCSAPKDPRAQQSLNQVRRVLEDRLAKIANKGTEGQRKGG